jgi:hypothetical protein
MTSNLTKDCRESRFASGSVCPTVKLRELSNTVNFMVANVSDARAVEKTLMIFRFLH